MPGKAFQAAYISAFKNGRLEQKVKQALAELENCRLCPRGCGVNRLKNERGFCRAGFKLEVASFSPHFGEESPLVGRKGSGTIFFTHCNLRCCFCQNYPISILGEGREVTFEQLGRMMVHLEKLGCHNINLVSPSHYVPQILAALKTAVEDGLSVPLVYNTGGYDSTAALKLLDGIIDIYMPDFKYMNAETASVYSQAADYPERTQKALKEMYRQVGDLVLDDRGIALRGLLIRHLVLPQNLAGTDEVVKFIASEISRWTYVNIMDQYYPCGKLPADSPIRKRLRPEEFREAVRAAKEAGLIRLDKKEPRFIVY
ncbi:MAG: radical SAM protein [Candidatus Aminicenantes bacterium]|nr:radical SAM protein [Candidatus Aminicenantes bacterium]